MLYTRPKYKAKRLEPCKPRSRTKYLGIILCKPLNPKVDRIKYFSRYILSIRLTYRL